MSTNTTQISRTVLASADTPAIPDNPSPEDGPWLFHGVALGESEEVHADKGGHLLFPRAELEAAAPTLVNTTTVDHIPDEELTTEDVVGEVTAAAYEPGVGVVYDLEVYDADLARKLRNDALEVSVEVGQPESQSTDEETGATVLHDFEFVRLSIVPDGASPSNTVIPGPASEDPTIAALAAATDADPGSAALAAIEDLDRGTIVSWPSAGDRPSFGVVQATIGERGTYDDALSGDHIVHGPAALIELYRPDADGDSGGEWASDGTIVAHKPATLTTYTDFPDPSATIRTSAVRAESAGGGDDSDRSGGSDGDTVPDDADTIVEAASSVGVDVFRIVADEDSEYESDLLGMGVDFPNHDVYVDWHLEAFGDDQLDNAHVSIYGSLEDLQQVTDGTIEVIGTVGSDTGGLAAAAESVVARADPSSTETPVAALAASIHDPTWSGTTSSGEWSRSSLSDFGEDAEPSDAAGAFLASVSGFPPDTYDDLKLQVVTSGGELSLPGLRAAASRLPQTGGLSDDEQDTLATKIANLANDNFEDAEFEGETSAEAAASAPPETTTDREVSHRTMQASTNTDGPAAALSSRIPTFSMYAYDAYNNEDTETAAANLNDIAGVTAVLSTPSNEEGDGHAEILLVVDRDGDADLNTLDDDIQAAVEETPFEVDDGFDWYEEATHGDLRAAAAAGDDEPNPTDDQPTADNPNDTMSDTDPQDDTPTDDAPDDVTTQRNGIDLDDEVIIEEERHQELQSKAALADDLETELDGVKSDLEHARENNEIVADVFASLLADRGPHSEAFYEDTPIATLRGEVKEVLDADENGGEEAALSAALTSPQTEDGGQTAAELGEHTEQAEKVAELETKRDNAADAGMEGAKEHYDERIAELSGDTAAAGGD